MLSLLAAAGIPSRLLAKPFLFEVDRLAGECRGSEVTVAQRRYRASATVSLFSIPVFSKSGVGSGFASIESASGAVERTVAIQFGAGSWPESAHGLNRLGFIQEVVKEGAEGEVKECTYLAFMTTSQEKSLEQAKVALEKSAPAVSYSAAEGTARDGIFDSRLEHVPLSSRLTWTDYPVLLEKVRDALSMQPLERLQKRFAAGQPIPSMFLYAVRNAMLAPDVQTAQTLIYNGKEFLLRTTRTPDMEAGTAFANRKLVQSADHVRRIDATLQEQLTGRLTPFRLWFEAGSEQLPPLSFEYRAKSFLRLKFEFDPTSAGPPIRLALNKETA